MVFAKSMIRETNRAADALSAVSISAQRTRSLIARVTGSPRADRFRLDSLGKQKAPLDVDKDAEHAELSGRGLVLELTPGNCTEAVGDNADHR